MEYEVEIEGRLRKVKVMVTRTRDGFAVKVDGHLWHVDAARIDAHRLSLLVGPPSPESDTGPADSRVPHHLRGPIPQGAGGASYDVAISPDPASARLIVHVGTTPVGVTLNGRRRPEQETAIAGAGPLRIVAPMPGKVVRILVQAGDGVQARQPLVVVEAMKMENELRAGRNGRVAAIHVQEGASVDAGALLVVIE